jgi:hypothetical protein
VPGGPISPARSQPELRRATAARAISSRSMNQAPQFVFNRSEFVQRLGNDDLFGRSFF